ncbi:DBH-like monooxygenase protein 1 [Desmophyllum pertusum]|uniref:DBH-like monooxygenase protein 1 n=1 Tax=Desmophyllum pertusum TaxID=174260 RepID=A0A9W9YPV4_9CNID|nr:DBH-like monooxygenase protein 1 [Desmophyllum pertusum]
MKKEVDKGSRSVLLLNKMDRRNVDETGWTKFTVTANVTIPANETTYWCTAVNGPNLTSTHHITAFKPIIKAGNEDLVDHYIVYGCHGFTENDFHGGVNCLGTEKVFTKVFSKCKQIHMIIVWTVGGEAFYLPQHVGVPIGGNDSPTSFLLQIAYHNPTNIKGRQDSSGVMLYYTDHLRTYEGGVVSVGVDTNDWQIIPPKQENWISTGYCMHQCNEDMFESTSPELPGGGIKIFATLIHIQSTGRAAWTKHVRDGKELPEIARLNTYDFKYQDTQILTKTQEVHIQPGDDLIHQCKYDSMKRNKLTKGGFFMQDEMCLDFLFYYPRNIWLVIMSKYLIRTF